MNEQLLKRGDLNAFGMQAVNDGEYTYPLAAEYLDALIESGALVPVEPPMTSDEWAAAMYRMQRLDAGHGSKHDIAETVHDMRKVLYWLRRLNYA